MNEGELTEPGQEGNECVVVGGSKQTANDEMKERRCEEGKMPGFMNHPSVLGGQERETSEGTSKDQGQGCSGP